MTVVGLDEKEAIKSLKKQFKDSDLKSGEKFKLEDMNAHIMELTGEDVDIKFKLFTNKDNSLIYLTTTPIDLLDILYGMKQ